MSKAQGIANSANQGQFKNRIINGDMRIDQRNAGASVTVSPATAPYTLDRWLARSPSGGGTFTVQQSSVAPEGFKNSLLCTVTSPASVGAADLYFLQQRIEGFNISDLGFGAASASTVTLSFWVRSSLTGSFGGSIGNNSDQSYPFSFTINSANTFEQKTITIPGSTSGTWLTNNSTGLLVSFSLGSGSSVTGTANAWGAYPFAPTGSVNPITTSGATFYITGVQLEKGSTATSFDYRPYGTELALCQRYYQKHLSSGGLTLFGRGYMPASVSAYPIPFTFPVTMRSDPTVSIIGTWTTLNSSQPVSPNSTISKPGLYASSVSSGDSYAYASATAGFSASSEL
jgi:hypothetical protein